MGRRLHRAGPGHRAGARHQPQRLDHRRRAGAQVRRDEAARFSFFLGTPAFLEAGLLQMADTLSTDAGQVTGNVLPLLAGFVASAVAGVIAIRFLLAYLRRRSLYVFALYCTVVGLAVIALTFIRP
ncbi:MAG: undecaprenyl-diphosphate phosphatase [Caldilineaceae bacterium]